MNLPTDTPAQEESLAAASAQPPSAWTSWTAHLRLWITVAIGLTADLTSKQWAFDRFKGRPYEVISNTLSFQLSENSGALWGLGRGMTPLFVAASILALFFVLYIFAHSSRGQRSFHIALGLVQAGALGNLYDRIFREGKVRDFIKIEWTIGEAEVWPWVFNIADALLVCGVAILMLNIWFHRKTPRVSECEQSTTPA